jgi:hypothetical protein
MRHSPQLDRDRCSHPHDQQNAIECYRNRLLHLLHPHLKHYLEVEDLDQNQVSNHQEGR